MGGTGVRVTVAKMGGAHCGKNGYMEKYKKKQHGTAKTINTPFLLKQTRDKKRNEQHSTTNR